MEDSFKMRHETKLATVENVVTAICFGVGALLVVLALYTLVAVKTVNARTIPLSHAVAVQGGTATAMPADIASGYRNAASESPAARHMVSG